MVDLGTLGGGFSEVHCGERLGARWSESAAPTTGSQHAFSWTKKGGMVDLGTLGGPGRRAVAVNDRGEVVGYSNTSTANSTRRCGW